MTVRALVLALVAESRLGERLVAQFRKHHPGAAAHVVIVGGHTAPPGVVEADWPWLRLIHAGPELVAAVRPSILHAALSELDPTETLLCLGADAEVHGPVGELNGLPDGALGVFPTRLSTAPRDGRMPDDVALRELGMVDHEIVVANAESAPAVDWWAQQVRGSVHLDPTRVRTPRFPWLDSGAATGRVRLHHFADPTLGVSPANADEPGRLPARLIRFVGFDAAHPWRFSPDRWARVWTSHHPWLREVTKARAEFVSGSAIAGPFLAYTDAGVPGVTKLGRPYDRLPGGQPIDPAMRRAAERGLLSAWGRNEPDPPNPWIPSNGPDRLEAETAFVRWLNEPAQPGSPTTRYLAAVHELRPDLARQIPVAEMATWAREHGRAGGIWWRLIPADPHDFVDSLAVGFLAVGFRAGGLPSGEDSTEPTTGTTTDLEDAPSSAGAVTRPAVPRPPGPPSPGVNLAGFLRGEFGIGEHARLLLRDLERTGESIAAISSALTAHRQEHAVDRALSTDNPHDVNIVVVYPDALPEFAATVGPQFFDDRITIGAWAWEVEGFPDQYRAAFNWVDEVWVESEHVRRAVAAAAPAGVEVHVIPLGVRGPEFGAVLGPVPDAKPVARAPDGRGGNVAADLPFTFLFAFDHESVTERKNPWGVLEAYRRAFPVPDQSTRLILKSISGDLHPDDHERLLFSVDRPDIEVRDGYLATADQHALMRSCDAYVSLHRAEGWGLTLIEAMAAGRPVIATGYSGNVDFMSPNNSWLIPFKLVPIPDSAGPYVGCGRWAEPDLNAAAQAMREVRTDPILARRKGQQAAADMGARAASSIGPDTIRARLRALRALRGAAPPAAAYPAASVAGARLADAPILHRHPSETPTGPLSSTTPQDTQETPMPADDTPSGHPPPFSHPGVGPVHLPVPPPLPGLPPGVRSAPRRAIVEAMQPFLEHQRTADTQRDVAVAHAIGETRLAVQALASEQVRLAQDVVTFSDMASKTLAHLEALQAAHDALAAQRADADAELAARLRREVEDLRADLEVLRRRTVP